MYRGRRNNIILCCCFFLGGGVPGTGIGFCTASKNEENILVNGVGTHWPSCQTGFNTIRIMGRQSQIIYDWYALELIDVRLLLYFETSTHVKVTTRQHRGCKVNCVKKLNGFKKINSMNKLVLWSSNRLVGYGSTNLHTSRYIYRDNNS